MLSAAKGRFLAFSKVTISDHRAVWLDIPAANLGMEQEQAIQRLAGRRLKCQDPHIIQKYNEHLETAIDTHQCLRQLKEVYKDGISTLTQTQLDTLETINMKLTIAKLEAERQCRKIHAGKIPWTPGLTIATYKLLYWQGIKKRITGGKISDKVL